MSSFPTVLFDSKPPEYLKHTNGSSMGNCNNTLTPLEISASGRQFRVRECYSQKTPERCRLLYSNRICWIVTALNFLKGFLMLLIASSRAEKPILTIGDAVASFLEFEDHTTKEMCMHSKHTFTKTGWQKEPQTYKPKLQPKFSASGLGRWIVCLTLYVSIFQLS